MSYFCGYVNVCVISLVKRLYKICDWYVVLKSFMFMYCLFCDGDFIFEDELMYVFWYGWCIFNFLDFWDEIYFNVWDYVVFVCIYGLFFIECLDCLLYVVGKSKFCWGRGGRGRFVYSKLFVRLSYWGFLGWGFCFCYGGFFDFCGYFYSDDCCYSNYDGGLLLWYGDRIWCWDDWDSKRNDRFVFFLVIFFLLENEVRVWGFCWCFWYVWMYLV